MLLVFSELPPHTTCFFAFLMIIDFTILCFTDNCRAMLCRRGLCRHAVYVCVSACLSRSWILSKRINISSFFSPSDSHTIPDFSHQTSRQYSDGNPLPITEASNAGGPLVGYAEIAILSQYLALSRAVNVKCNTLSCDGPWRVDDTRRSDGVC